MEPRLQQSPPDLHTGLCGVSGNLARDQPAAQHLFIPPHPLDYWRGSQVASFHPFLHPKLVGYQMEVKQPGSRLAPPGVTLTAQDDPAILVGSGESCEEAFDVHQRGSGPRCPVLPLLCGGCRSCTEQRKEKGLGARTAGGSLHLG